MPDDPQTTQTTPPQQQPGPSRTPDGTIVDQASQTTTDTTQQKQSTSTDSSTAQTDSSKTPFNVKKEGDTAPQGAPDKYADFKVPDGYTLDTAVAEEAGKLFKSLNLSQEASQNLVDFYVKQTTAAHEAPFKAFADMTKSWRDEVTKTYGADLAEGGKHYVAVGKLLSQLGPAEQAFRTAMDETGVGSHPAFVAAFIKFAEFLGEGGHVAGGGPSPLGQSRTGTTERPTAAQALYPHLPSSAGQR